MNSSARAKNRRNRTGVSRPGALRSLVAAATGAILALTGVLVGATPAWADLGDPGQITLDKAVDMQAAITAEPGDTFTYGFLVGCDDNPCIDAVLDDQLPPQFAGFKIENLQVSPPSAPVDAALTGCTVGGNVTASCLLHADFKAPLGDLGGTPQVGIDAGVTYRVNIQLTVPLGLPATWAYNGVPVVNTATADAISSVTSATDSATVTVDIPIVIDVEPAKSWSPTSQLFNPGEASTFNIGAQNTSNLPAESLVLQDPAVASDGATDLDASNPFTFVDFAGLCAPGDLPAGADLVQVDLYVRPAPTDPWNWVTGTASAVPTLPVYAGEVGGLRLTYTSTTGATIAAGGTASAQCVSVTQRADNRTTGATLLTGVTVDNTVDATLTVPGHPAVSDTANAALTIGPLDVVILPGKTITPDVIPAGAAFDVNLSARNQSNGPLTSLTITEPAPAAAAFLSDELTFGSFSSWTWPAGATAGTWVWHFDAAADQPVAITEAGGAPAVPTPAPGDWITGFSVTYTGSIPSGEAAGFVFSVDTDPAMVPPPPAVPWEQYTNQIQVSGTNPAGTDTKPAQDDVRIYYPEIELDIEKVLQPALVTPGGTVVAMLQAETATNSARVDPTQIVVADVWDGTADTAAWDAFRARELSFIQVPTGTELSVAYATGTPPALTWNVLTTGETGPLYSADLVALLGQSTANSIVGLRFTFDNPTGFPQGTIVQPNVVFEAASTLRTGGPTTTTPGVPVEYDNVATADGSGESGGQTLTADQVEDDASTQIVAYGGGGGGTGPGPGTLLADKDWVQSNWTSDLNSLPSQSGSTARTAHGWGVTVPGYDSVVLSDPLPGTEGTPGATAFQAFNLTGIRAITFVQDPLLRWDQVTAVELYVGGVWTTVPAPGGDWMSATGFKGYNPTGADLTTLRSATGVRIVIAADDDARNASTEPGRPAPGTGVAWGATERPLWLQWELRNAMRSPSGTGWVTASQAFNGGLGTITNSFRVAGTAGASTYSADASDNIGLIDNPPGVGVAKAVTTSPVTTPPAVVVPYPGDVPPSAYPQVTFVVDTWNTVAARASYLRVADPVPCATPAACVTPGSDRDPDVFTGNTYNPATNPFDRFTITDVSFVVPAGMPVDQTATQVALWHYDTATGATSVTTTTMAAVAAMTTVDLADVVGIGIVYQSTDPATTGGLFPQGSATSNNIRLNIDAQLRVNLRSDSAVLVTGGVSVENDTFAQSYDPVMYPALTPNASALAPVQLRASGLDVTASKTISPSTIVETNPSVPVTVTLGATDGLATAAPETVTISDTDAGFWASFELVALGAVTRPAGADLARVDVQLDGDPTWVVGTAVASPTAPALPGTLSLPADLERITGIRYVFNNDPASPFSATAPSADWTAEAVLTVQLRAGVPFPGAVSNTVETRAEHPGLPPASDTDTDNVFLSKGTPRIDVQKEPVTGGPKIVEPGVVYPWTLEFENVGTAFFTVNELVDDLGTHLRYDGSAPLFETNAVSMPVTGVTLTQTGPSNLTFAFPAGAVLAPGEWYRITVNLSLTPGLTPAQQAVNTFLVDTDVVFAAGDCVNTSGNGQGVLAGVAANQCGTSNYVSPQAGPLLFAEKEVRGEIDGTLVDGASNNQDAALPCTPTGDGFYTGACVAFSAIGATDEWRIGAANTGTIAYTELTFVDVLPTVGDRMLATGGARGSDWRPVFDLGFGIQEDVVAGFPMEGVPAGATVTMQVTTDIAPCVGTGAGSNWPTDSVCSGNNWQALAGYAGDPADITGIRVILDFTTTGPGVLLPGESMHFLYRTINVPWEAGDTPSAEAIQPQLNLGPTPKAWNQVGVTAGLAAGGDLRRAPARVGVQLLTGSAEVEKTVSGVTALAPAQVTVDALCTVPGGAAGPAAVDLGALAVLPVPTGGTARLDGIPLGASCSFEETGSLGSFGEVARTTGSQVVVIDTVGTAADPVPVLQSVSFDNRYEPLPVTGADARLPLAIALALLLGGGLLLALRLIPRRLLPTRR